MFRHQILVGGREADAELLFFQFYYARILDPLTIKKFHLPNCSWKMACEDFPSAHSQFGQSTVSIMTLEPSGRSRICSPTWRRTAISSAKSMA